MSDWIAVTLCSVALTFEGCVKPPTATAAPPSASPAGATEKQPQEPALRPGVVRYQVGDVDRSIAFYTQQLGFHLDQKVGSAFASVSQGNLQLILSGPGSSGARPMPDGQRQQPGGWNRIVIYVNDLGARIEALTAAGAHFRNHIEVGPGGQQVQVDDPDGNPVELHQASPDASK